MYFLDTEKAFDRMEWGFPKQVLGKINFGPIFQQWINMIYDKQHAKVAMKGQESLNILIGRGVRQGCPLSPLPFYIGIEVLAIMIKNRVYKQLNEVKR